MDDPQTTSQERHVIAALAGETGTWTPACPTPERMIALAEESLPEIETTALLSHIALCTRCRREYAQTRELLQLSADVRALESAAAPSPTAPIATPKPSFWQRWLGGSWRSPALGLSLAAAGGVYFGIARPALQSAQRLAAQVKSRDAALARSEQARETTAQELETLRRRNQSDRTQLAREVTRLRSQVRVQVAQLSASEAALAEMPLPVASWTLPAAGAQVRGSGGAEQAPLLTLIAPVGIALTETRPVFACERVAGATAYQATLEIDSERGEAPALRPLSLTRWTPIAPLRPGVRYRWAVSVTRGDELLQSAPARFYVLSEKERAEAATARKRLSGKPLAQAALYARLGLRDDARATLRAVPPTDPTARRWLAELDAVTAGRR